MQLKKWTILWTIIFTSFFYRSNGNQIIVSKDSLINVTIPSVDIASHLLNFSFLESNKDIIVIEQKDFKNYAIHQPVDLLKYLSEFEVVERGPNGVQSDIKMTGGTFEQVLILINGHKIMDAQTGHHLMNLPIDMEQVSRVEVLRGAAARIYGINSLVGAINFVIKDDKDSNLEVNLATGSNFEKNEEEKIYNNLNARVAGNWSIGSTKHLLSTAYHKGNGYRYNTQYEQAKLFYTFSNQWKNGVKLNVLASGIYNDFGTNGFYAAPNDKESVETVNTGFAGIDLSWPMTQKWNASFKTSYRYNHDDYRFIKSNPSYYQNIHNNHLMQAQWMNMHGLDWLDVRWGVDFNQNWIRSSNLGDWNRSNTGLFLDLLPKWNLPIQLNGGVYVNYNEDWGWNWLPGLDASYKILPWMSVFGGWSTGQRIPTYTDLYYVGPENKGNPLLKPETSQQFELGWKAQKGNSYLKLSTFHRTINDLIDWVRTDVNEPWMPDNFGKVHALGVHLNAKWQTDLTKDLELVLMPSYTYLNNKTSHFEGVMSHYQLEYLKNKLALLTHLSYQQKWILAPAYRIEQRMSDSYFNIIDLRLTYQFDHGQVYVDMNNLTNVKQVDAYALPLVGRWINLGLRFNLR